MASIRISILAAMVAAILPAIAQQPGFTPADRQRWLGEMRTLKHDFIARELELDQEQKDRFFELYDSMEDDIANLNTETREAETRVASDSEATDLMIQNTARTVFEQKRAEGQIEMTYFDQFSQILTPRQLLQLKNAERKFTQQLVNRRRALRRSDNR
ncbi:MAG: hypothetical protein NC406_01130 [Bacteroides sp.]|nr:hypothetical protein [Bacteroides sp.]MCM1094699.1 hypothetical protein [Terasakiella sp.]